MPTYQYFYVISNIDAYISVFSCNFNLSSQYAKQWKNSNYNSYNSYIAQEFFLMQGAYKASPAGYLPCCNYLCPRAFCRKKVCNAYTLIYQLIFCGSARVGHQTRKMKQREERMKGVVTLNWVTARRKGKRRNRKPRYVVYTNVLFRTST